MFRALKSLANLRTLSNEARSSERHSTLAFDVQFGVNHLGHFLLSNLLLERLVQGAPSRLISVSSMGHKMGKLNFDDLNWEKGYSAWAAYGTSKLFNILFANEFQKRFGSRGVTANSLHPGAIHTELGRHSAIANLFYVVGSPFMKTIPQGAATQVYLAVSKEVEGVGGKFYDDCNEYVPTQDARDEKAAERLWKVSEELTGLKQV